VASEIKSLQDRFYGGKGVYQIQESNFKNLAGWLVVWTDQMEDKSKPPCLGWKVVLHLLLCELQFAMTCEKVSFR
jgi:hypothetical protein